MLYVSVEPGTASPLRSATGRPEMATDLEACTYTSPSSQCRIDGRYTGRYGDRANARSDPVVAAAGSWLCWHTSAPAAFRLHTRAWVTTFPARATVARKVTRRSSPALREPRGNCRRRASGDTSTLAPSTTTDPLTRSTFLGMPQKYSTCRVRWLPWFATTDTNSTTSPRFTFACPFTARISSETSMNALASRATTVGWLARPTVEVVYSCSPSTITSPCRVIA
mmetsp:Transcript_11518/g.32351  ORF Transcript_11518/g.32351 Transcript_11518/m.32351 type:complete len:224 (-) Transcript_11518:471-1142(-)